LEPALEELMAKSNSMLVKSLVAPAPEKEGGAKKKKKRSTLAGKNKIFYCFGLVYLVLF
jgi:hypothetical protein